MPLFPKRQSPESNLDWQHRFRELAANAKDSRLKAYYERGVPAGDTPIKEVPMVGMDFETTGLDAETHSIVSVGLVPFDYQRIYCRQAHHWVVRPVLPLHRESVTFHGITHSEIRQAPDIKDVIGELLEALAGKIVVVHYRNIERQFLDAAFRWRLKEGIEFPVVDTMELEARWHRHKPHGLWAQVRGRKHESIRLADSRTRYGLPYYAPHHALTDALATAELLQAQLQHRFTPETPLKELWR
ncbi:3'-5' exonuclease [Marinobacter fonticola]|uniref:3'-5' exonuclease n=1 Tax=Marinobacter fonticola TaxID=2603215 RepID=UPI0011E83BDB|nr:3'-5' exonuclease [Marinobacter fonticola]